MFAMIAIVLLALFFAAVLWRRRWERRQKATRIRQLRTWAAAHQALDPALQRWMERLSAVEAEELLGLLQGYCASLNWELSWLFAPQIKKAPALKAALDESVSAYIQSILVSLQMEEDVRAYQAYLAFEKKPAARKHGAFVEALYGKIDHTPLVPTATARFGQLLRKVVPHQAVPHKAATRKEQVAAIQQAFEQDPARTMAALKAVLGNEVTVNLQPAQHAFAPATAGVLAGATA